MERMNRTAQSTPGGRLAAMVTRAVFDRQFAIRCAAAAIIGCSLVAISEGPAISQQVVIVDVNAVSQGYRVSKLLGKPVVNDMNQTIGTLDDLIVGKDKQLFAVLQVGGFLGLGGHLVAIQYDALMIPPDASKITLAGANKDTLIKLPEFIYRQP